MLYSDSDGVTVWAPTVRGSARAGDLTVSAQVAVDVVSAASVDLVSAASPQGFEEVRGGAGADLSLRLGPGHEISAGYSGSTERDFTQHSLRLGHMIDVFQRMSTLSVGYSFAHSDVYRARDELFREARQTHELSLGWTQILSRVTMLDGWVGGGLTHGFQASPYRFVRIFESGSRAQSTAVREVTPEDRWLGVLGVRLRTRLLENVFWAGSYRAYLDSWGVSAHTLSVRVSKTLFDDRLLVGLEGRGYVQSGARFYAERYETFPFVPELRTADKELGPMWTALGGLNLEWSFEFEQTEVLRVGASLSAYHMSYLEHPLLDGRTALISTVDVSLER